MGLFGQVLVVEGRGKGSPCLIEVIPAGSRMDLLLTQAEPISDCGSASGIRLLKGQKLLHNSQREKWEHWERSSSADSKVTEERGRRCFRYQCRDCPAAHDEDHGVAGCAPAAPQGSRDPPAASGGPHGGTCRYLKEAVTLWEPHTREGFLAELVTCDLAGDPCWSN